MDMLTKFIIPPEMVPLSGLNPLFKHVSGARQAMFTGNLAQALVVDGMTRRRIQSGLEREYSKATFSHEFTSHCVIKAVIPRFSSTMFGEEFEINPMDLVIYEDFDSGELDVIELTKFHVMHQHFGFAFQFNDEVVAKLAKGARFKPGTKIATSPAVAADGDSMFGLETIVCNLTDPAVTEDGIVYSQSYTERLRATGYETRTITCGRTHYPINAYGNAEIYKPVPDIGEYINESGLVCATRPYSPMFDARYMSRKMLFKPIFGLDVPVYGIPGGRVVDISVLHNDRISTHKIPDLMSAQFRRYAEADKRFAIEVIRNTIFRRGRLDNDVSMSKRLNEIVYQCISLAGEDLIKENIFTKQDSDVLRARMNFRGEMLDEFRIELTYEYKSFVGEGPKSTDSSGSKGVGVAVWPDADMPTDKFGNRADVIIMPGAVSNRQNVGRAHEQLISAAGRDVIKRMRRSYGLKDMGVIDISDIADAVHGDLELSRKNFDYLMGFYEKVTPTRNFRVLSKPEVIPSGRYLRHLIQVLKDGDQPHGLYLQMPSDAPIDMAEIVTWLKHSEYRPEMSTVTYRNVAGQLVTTKTEVLLGSNYYMGLEKTATDGSGVSSSKTNHFGVTARLTNADKYTSPSRQTVTRSSGESELRNHGHAHGSEVSANITDMNNNPVIHKEVCRTILTHETPTNIESVVDREKFPIGGHRPANYARHQLICSGKNISRK